MARRGTAGGGGLAVAGILCAVLGMIPTALMGIAIVGIGAAGPEMFLEVVEDDGPAGVTLRISRNEFFKNKEAYSIQQDTSNISGVSGSSGVEEVEFEFDSMPDEQAKFTGTLQVKAPKKLEISVELENEVPFQLGIDGLNDVAAQEDDQPLSLDELLPPGKHSIRLTGSAP